MKPVARAERLKVESSARHFDIAARTLLGFCGAILSIVGIIFAAGGLMSTSDGSAFYMLVGLLLTVSGALIAKRHRAGAWTYLAVVALTASWSLRNVDQGPSLGYRLIGPTLLIAMLAALLPPLSRWRPRHAAMAFLAVLSVTVAVGLASRGGEPLARQAAAVTQFLEPPSGIAQ